MLQEKADKPPKEELILLEKLCFYEEKVAFDSLKTRAAATTQQAPRPAAPLPHAPPPVGINMATFRNPLGVATPTTSTTTTTPLGPGMPAMSLPVHLTSPLGGMHALSQYSQIRTNFGSNLTSTNLASHTLSMKDFEKNNPMQQKLQSQQPQQPQQPTQPPTHP